MKKQIWNGQNKSSGESSGYQNEWFVITKNKPQNVKSPSTQSSPSELLELVKLSGFFYLVSKKFFVFTFNKVFSVWKIFWARNFFWEMKYSHQIISLSKNIFQERDSTEWLNGVKRTVSRSATEKSGNSARGYNVTS